MPKRLSKTAKKPKPVQPVTGYVYCSYCPQANLSYVAYETQPGNYFWAENRTPFTCKGAAAVFATPDTPQAKACAKQFRNLDKRYIKGWAYIGPYPAQ